MRFSKTVCLFIIAAAAIAAVGCGRESTQNTGQQNAAASTESQAVALPGESPAFIGKVKDIVGNEVTVYKAEVNQSQAAPKEAPAGSQPQSQDQSQAQNQAGGAGVPGNRGFAMKFTEETQTFIIPVGTPIVTMQRGAGGASSKQAGLTDIKKESILRVWEKDGEVSFVQLTGAGGAAGNRQGAGSGNPQGMGGGPQGMGGGPQGIGG
ncbi:MAG: hypothetical protein JL50_02715 [Peptococcaceae bacterium BICA1-7]|nr:MAG: hypothetical protein JL50_02715 [Peptococcaceae bacterium BICA1-7]HBV97824.1 hypothetical protein [Desulfotomaculum sp.]